MDSKGGGLVIFTYTVPVDFCESQQGQPKHGAAHSASFDFKANWPRSAHLNHPFGLGISITREGAGRHADWKGDPETARHLSPAA